MTANDYIFWLHGFFEISESNTLSEKQVQVIKDHLDLCFSKVTPDRSSTGRTVGTIFDKQTIDTKYC